MMNILGVSSAAAGSTVLPAAQTKSVRPPGPFNQPPGVLEQRRGVRLAAIIDGKVIQPERELPVLHKTDVLVVGGGTAGFSAAISARRTGVKVALVERYGQLGGMWSGAMVLMIEGHNALGKKQVIFGNAEEIMKRLETLDRGIINRGKPGVSPTADPEALKYLMGEMVREEGIDLFLHCWGVDVIMDRQVVRGVVFESKSGRQAILAEQVVDASGDGDVFAAAGAAYFKRTWPIGLVYRIGNLDKVDRSKAGAAAPRRIGGPTPLDGVNWVNVTGPVADGLNVADLTRLELDHRRDAWQRVQELRKIPGYESVYLHDVASQLGVRMTRVLQGVETMTHEGYEDRKYPNCVGVGASSNPIKEYEVPFGALVPKEIDNVLAAGRCISADARMTGTRLISPTFLTGQAAGCAAALAVQDRCRVRNVNVPKLQALLRKQGVYLG